MVDVFGAVQNVGHPKEAEDRPEDQPSHQAEDAGKEVSCTAGTILQDGLHLSSLAVRDGHRILSEANRRYEGRLGLYHSGGGLLLCLRGWGALRGRKH